MCRPSKPSQNTWQGIFRSENTTAQTRLLFVLPGSRCSILFVQIKVVLTQTRHNPYILLSTPVAELLRHIKCMPFPKSSESCQGDHITKLACKHDVRGEPHLSKSTLTLTFTVLTPSRDKRRYWIAEKRY